MANSKDWQMKEKNNQDQGKSGAKAKVLTGPLGSGGGEKGNKGDGGGIFRQTKSPFK